MSIFFSGYVASTTASPPPPTPAKTTSAPVKTTSAPVKTTKSPLAGFCKGKKDGNYKHPTRCDKFISCVASKYMYIRDCPATLYYNAKTDRCDWPGTVPGCPGNTFLLVLLVFPF